MFFFPIILRHSSIIEYEEEDKILYGGCHVLLSRVTPPYGQMNKKSVNTLFCLVPTRTQLFQKLLVMAIKLIKINLKQFIGQNFKYLTKNI